MKKRDQEYNKLFREYKQLAKRADQRLVRLEKLSKQSGYENVLSWGYRKAMRNIHYWTGEASKRFNTKAPNNINMLKAKIRDIKDFLSYQTSTKKGIQKTYKKRADTINRKYGTNFTWEDIGNYFESSIYEKLEKEYGSKTALKATGEIQKNEKSIVNSIKKNKGQNLNIGNGKVKKAVNSIIDDYGIDLVNLFT